MEQHTEFYREWLTERGVIGLGPIELFQDTYGGIGLKALSHIPQGHVVVVPKTLQVTADVARQAIDSLAGARIYCVPETGIDKQVLGCQSDGSEGILEDEVSSSRNRGIRPILC